MLLKVLPMLFEYKPPLDALADHIQNTSSFPLHTAEVCVFSAAMPVGIYQITITSNTHDSENMIMEASVDVYHWSVPCHQGPGAFSHDSILSHRPLPEHCRSSFDPHICSIDASKVCILCA